jgi:hypothetical protein
MWGGCSHGVGAAFVSDRSAARAVIIWLHACARRHKLDLDGHAMLLIRAHFPSSRTRAQSFSRWCGCSLRRLALQGAVRKPCYDGDGMKAIASSDSLAGRNGITMVPGPSDGPHQSTRALLMSRLPPGFLEAHARALDERKLQRRVCRPNLTQRSVCHGRERFSR